MEDHRAQKDALQGIPVPVISREFTTLLLDNCDLSRLQLVELNTLLRLGELALRVENARLTEMVSGREREIKTTRELKDTHIAIPHLKLLSQMFSTVSPEQNIVPLHSMNPAELHAFLVESNVICDENYSFKDSRIDGDDLLHMTDLRGRLLQPPYQLTDTKIDKLERLLQKFRAPTRPG